MFLYHYIQRLVLGTIRNNRDLIVLWVLLIAYLPHISVDNPLARPDLVPWLMFCLSGAVLLRGKRYGDGPHVSLTKQVSLIGHIFQSAAMLLTPITLVYWFDLGVYLHFVSPLAPNMIEPLGIHLACHRFCCGDSGLF